MSSVRTQLVLWNVLALALLLAVLGLTLRYAVGATILSSIDRDLDRRTARFAAAPPPPPADGRPPDNNRPFPSPERPPQRFEHHPHFGDGSLDRPRAFNEKGQPLRPFDSDLPWDRAALTASLHGQTVFSTVSVSGVALRVISRPFAREEAKRGEEARRGAVQAAYPLAGIRRAQVGLDRTLLTLAPLALLLAGAGGAWLTGRVLKRVGRMTQAAAQIGAQDLSARLPASGRDEFSQLAETFNSLLDRLEAAFTRQRQFIADASHELKTPLTIVQGNTSLALSGSPNAALSQQLMQEIDAAAVSMARLVGDLLLLARGDGGQFARDPIDVPVIEVLERALSRLPSRSEAAPVQFCLPDRELRLHGNEDELTRLFANLLENAQRHTPADGEICVSAAPAESGLLRITVADTGPGIAPEHLAHLGERFYRVDAARARIDGGTGLGLAISRGIAEAHGGRLTIESVVGNGTTVTVRLPSGR